ncbi:AsnC family protein [Saccharopolyspora sp. NPDC050389]|uniref:AsnC family protein n=1 Tax=Saccharopolyspora sp. NPDC050389 TaxID=3155516 RepID=UPI0034065695
MAGPDPVDVRLLSVVAEMGRAAVPEIAGRLGMDVRDVAARLAALSTTGLPLVVGVECDAQAIRNAVAAAQHWAAQQNMASGPYQVPGPGSGGHQVQPSGSYPQPTGGYPMPSGSYPTPYGGPNGPQPFVPTGPPATSFQQQPAPQGPPNPMNVWGPPGSAAWARGDQQWPGAQPAQQQPPPVRTGKVGSKLDVEGLEGERITILLVEVVDPADFLFTAAGYELQEGERSVVVHTELTNRGATPFASLPDLYLELIAEDGAAVSKAPVSLSSRPPHRIGVQPGETAGGHTVYVLPENTELTKVRWTPRPGDEQRTLTWDITDL